MRGTKAKALRAKIYGNQSRRNASLYGWLRALKCILNLGLRGEYQRLKRGTYWLPTS